jgi:leucine-zipper-like transcriptional regulator 1
VMDLQTKEWNPVLYSGVGPGRRRSHMMINHQDVEFVLFGGFDGRHFLNDLWCFDVENRKWREVLVTGSIPSQRRYFSFSKSDEGIYIFGGVALKGDRVGLSDDFYLLCDASEKFLFIENLKKSKDFFDVLVSFQ